MESTTVASKRGLAVGLCTGVLAIAFEGMSVSTAMPAAAQDLGRLDLYAWIFSLFTIGMLFATVVGGRIADRRGPLVPLALGFGVFLVGLLVAGFAPAMEVLLAGRLLQGLGSGSLNVAYAVLLVHAFDATERPRIMSWFSTAWVVPSLVGPSIAAFVTRVLSWHWVFFSVLPLLALAAAVGGPAVARLPRTLLRGAADATGARPVPIWAALVAALGTTGLQWVGQMLAAPDRTAGWLVTLAAVASIVGLGVAVPVMMPRRSGGMGALMPPIAVRALVGGAFFGASSFFPLLMVQVYGWSLLAAGAMLTVGAIGWASGAWIQSHRGLGWRRDQVLRAGVASVVLGLGVLVAVPWSGMPWLAVVGWVLAGLGMGMSMASTTLVVMLVSPLADQGRNNAALQVAEALGSTLLVGLAGTVYAWLAPGGLTGAFGWLLASMTAFAVLGLGAAVRVGRVTDHS
jgi:MFS family permease